MHSMKEELLPMKQGETVLEALHISKAFPGVQALDDVSLFLQRGEIHGLIGENGAGKSTLIKIISGLYQPDEGEILVEEKKVRFSTPRDSVEAGVGFIPQERNLIPDFTVGENVLLEKLNRSGMFVSYSKINAEARQWLNAVGLKVLPTVVVSELSPAQMQLVETAKALALKSKILLLDEPTASLTPYEVEFLFGVLRKLRDSGVALLFVTHKLEEVFALCDKVTVLRDGHVVAQSEPIETLNRDRLITLMIGRKYVVTQLPTKPARAESPILEVKDVYSDVGTEGVSLKLYSGEVLGLYGLVGAGRTEFARALIGDARITQGEVRVDGKIAHIKNVADALHKYGIGYVSENRKAEGLILSHSVVTNITITVWDRIAKMFGVVRRAEERTIAEKFVEQLDIKTSSLEQIVMYLSGGNQQKVALAKWLTANTRILIIDEPTIGIDIKTKYALHDLIWDLAANGVAILLISSDMPEIVRLSDRILVMKDHRIVGELGNSRQYEEMSQMIGKLLT